MDSQHLNKLLEQLQDEIKDTQAVDDKGTELLRGLDADIHALLEKSQDNSDQWEQTDVQSLEAAVYHFEATHPKLTALVSRLLESLSNAGI